MGIHDHILYGLLWLSFGLLHSVLASDTAKRATQALFGAWERLVYNVIAVAHVGMVWGLGAFLLGGRTAVAFDLSPVIQVVMWTCGVVGVLILLVACRQYDGGRFTGLRPVSGDAEAEPLHTTGLHRYVRHPFYSGAFLLLFWQATDAFGLATCIWASLYLVIGTWFEERRLNALYGPAYLTYSAQVPAFVPWKGRALR